MNVTIRRAVEADASAITRLTSQLGYPAEVEVMRGRLKPIVDCADHLVLAAEDAGDVCGWIQAQSAEVLESGFRVEIVGLIVAEGRRREGIGRRLVRSVEAWAAQAGAPAVVVRTNIARAESPPFYTSLGFAQTKTQRVYRKTLNATSQALV